MRERDTIYRRVDLRPYGSRVGLVFGEENSPGVDAEVALLVHDDLIVTLKPRPSSHDTGQRFTATVEGFATAGEAENAGLKFALALLWTAVSLACPLRLDYHTPLPCLVYDRTPRGGLHISDEFYGARLLGPAGIAAEIQAAFGQDRDVDRKLLVSMELFAAARLEVTERARFIGLVSSLEPLVNQLTLSGPALALVDRYVAELDQAQVTAEEAASLRGRILELRRESISQAIRRLVRETLLGDGDAVAAVRDAYTIRSKILHEGGTDADLRAHGAAVESALRRLYAARLNLPLAVPAV